MLDVEMLETQQCLLSSLKQENNYRPLAISHKRMHINKHIYITIGITMSKYKPCRNITKIEEFRVLHLRKREVKNLCMGPKVFSTKIAMGIEPQL